MTDFEQLLKKFASLPRVRRTFMQIAGYPHYENVCSNILAFFLDPENEHGLGDLLLVAFLTCLGKQDLPISSVKINRDIDRKRLDLLVKSDTFILAIENKIWHSVANPLHIYNQGVTAASGGREPLKIVLSPQKNELAKMKDSGFVSVTYAELFAHLKPRIGHYSAKADEGTYVTYLKDFIKTIESLMGANIENQENTAFFQEHGRDIEALGEQYQAFKKNQFQELRSCLPSLAELNQPAFAELKSPITIESWPSNDLKLFYKFGVENISIQMDTAWYGNRWRTAIYANRKAGHFQALLSSIVEQVVPPFQKTDYGACYISPEKASAVQVAAEVEMLLRKIIDSLNLLD